MAPSFGSYIAGCLALIGIIAALGLGGYWLRRWIVPEFTGALARLADATLAIALLIVCLQVLGSLSLLYFGWIVLLCVGVGLGAAWLGRAKAAGHGREVAGPRVETAALLIATLSAPARSNVLTSSSVRTPPPTVSGMNTCSAVRRTTSIIVARSPDEAVTSRKVSSSAPSAS